MRLDRAAIFQTLVWDLRLFVILQTFCYTADFSTNFSYMLKTKIFFHKTTSKHSEFNNFDSILQKISVTPDKNGKITPTNPAPPVPGQAYDLR